MPLKTKTPVKTKKHPKHFMKVYHPYLPLLFIMAFGFFAFLRTDLRPQGDVLGYATNIQQQSLLESTNKERSSRGLSALTLNPNLANAASHKAEDMANRDYWSHDTPDGVEPWYFIQQAGYSYAKAAENLAYGFSTSDSTVNGWMNSPSHRANLLDPALREVGFGVMNTPNYQGEGPETIVVAMYGQPSGVAVSNNQGQILADQSPTRISYIQNLTGGHAPWSTFAAGLILGVVGFYLVTKHTLSLRRALRRSERFVVHHPLLDITLIALVALVAVLSQTNGVIQ